ncbi:hypothetical protein HAX54_016475 [Datura stramonium]|uniref:Bifunctional inhibitor/plant lipid transfer protein/seed storage helical domain-containing protein n=1 Tax=Datura stramonium TaxID=4076 RepID=A0ABS8UIX6_DATST|nr:hypothetical protein [Datura stramonium]
MIQGIVTTLLLLVIHLGGSNSQYSPWPPVAPRPLCLSQFALVNHACQFLPYTPLPPTPPVPPVSDPSPSPEPSQELLPPPPPPPSSANIGTPIEDECCRWMRSVDSVCVCALLAHLPTFLSRPVHQYTTVPHPACSVTFVCSSSLKLDNDQKSPQSP